METDKKTMQMSFSTKKQNFFGIVLKNQNKKKKKKERKKKTKDLFQVSISFILVTP